jgi:hypothetical protein
MVDSSVKAAGTVPVKLVPRHSNYPSLFESPGLCISFILVRS